jgi:putative membrane protein
MSEGPRVFRLDDPSIEVSQASAPLPDGVRARVSVNDADDVFDVDAEALDARDAHKAELSLGRRLLGWGGVLAGSLFGLVLLWLGTALENFIGNLLQEQPVLGVIAAALAALALLALFVLVGREVRAILRARAIAALKQRAEAVLVSDDRKAGRAVLAELHALYASRPDTARARARLEETSADIIDGADLVRLAERELMQTLDREARAAVAAAAKRVSVVTAISPRAIVDVAFVAAQALRLIRRISEIYGGRPGFLGFLRVLRGVAAHLAVTGGMAVGDSLVQQVLGHGIAARLSARLGEGVLNGLLTARVGISAIAVCRPLPFAAEPQPGLRDVAGFLFEKDGAAKSAR